MRSRESRTQGRDPRPQRIGAAKASILFNEKNCCGSEVNGLSIFPLVDNVCILVTCINTVSNEVYMISIVLLALSILSFTGVVAAEEIPIIRWPVVHTDLDISFDIEGHAISGTAKLTLPGNGQSKVGFLLNKEFLIHKASIAGKLIELNRTENFDPAELSPIYGVFGEWHATSATLWTASLPRKDRKRESLELEITYSGSLYTPPDDRQFSRERIAFEVNGTIGPEGIYLSPSSYWYPGLPDGLATHLVLAKLPKGWNCATEGFNNAVIEADDNTVISHSSVTVTEGIHFSAGPYVVNSIKHGNTTLTTYFLPAQAELSESYLQACKGYMDMYCEILSDYPFRKFAVVDNFLPSGYGMPGWTLLGSEVLHLPFIKDTSLGHEILHNWFGNSLFVDYRGGNWCEGLTVYLADYKYKADSDSAAGVEYRRGQLRDFAAYVNDKNDYPASAFVSRSDPHDRAIGYGKVMMIFHMLKKMSEDTDPDLFNKTLSETYKKYQWQPISWDHWAVAFEESYGQKLDWFFDRWVAGTGAPTMSIHDVKVMPALKGWQVKFSVQTDPGEADYKYLLPVRSINSEGTVQDEKIFIDKSHQEIILKGAGELKSLQLDPAFDVFRHVYQGEIPLTIAAFFGDPDGILVVPSVGVNADKWRTAAEGLKTEGQRVIADAEFTKDLASHSLWIFGSKENNSVYENLPQNIVGMDTEIRDITTNEPIMDSDGNGIHAVNDSTVVTIIKRNRKASDRCIMFTAANAEDNADPVAGTRKLPHYGKYTEIAFEGDRNIHKGIRPPSGDSPMRWKADK